MHHGKLQAKFITAHVPAWKIRIRILQTSPLLQVPCIQNPAQRSLSTHHTSSMASTSCAGDVSFPWISSEHAAAGGDGPKAAQLSIHNFSCCLTTSDRSSLSGVISRTV